jgi:hypothetical protein
MQEAQDDLDERAEPCFDLSTPHTASRDYTTYNI